MPKFSKIIKQPNSLNLNRIYAKCEIKQAQT